MTIPGAVQVIYELARNHPQLAVGAGTVLDLDNARRCLDAGAKFLTSPGLDLEIVDFALKQNTVVFPGALTPTDVMTAWKAGSDFAKVFPFAPLGGPTYIETLKVPFPSVPWVALSACTQHTP